MFAALAFFAVAGVARAECSGLTQAQATFDRAIPSTDFLKALRGPAAEEHVKSIDAAIAQARTCLHAGSVDDRSSALAFISALVYRQAYILTHDGIATDRAAAVNLVKQNQGELNTFASTHSLSSQNQADVDNWLHWDDVMINQPDEACLGC